MLERSCLKWGFLSRFKDRLAFAVSVFHAFGHEWACQLLYHPRKRTGLERFWQSISHLIAHLRICGYHNRLYTLDAQIQHADESSLMRLGEWIARRLAHCVQKRAEATKTLRDCGKPMALLREQWQLQVIAQTKPLPRRSKNTAKKPCMVLCFCNDDPHAALYQTELESIQEALAKAEASLQRKEEALGVDEHQELEQLLNSEYMRLRMNTRALKLRLRQRLRWRKFELDPVERNLRRLVNDSKLHAHTASAVKRREPTIAKVASEYNKLCAQIEKLIKQGQAPPGSIAPFPIPPKGLWQLDVDDTIFQDVGLAEDDDDQEAGEPPLWLSDEQVRTGIKAMLELDRCDEEDDRLLKEACALRVWFAEEWKTVQALLKMLSDVDRYHLQLHEDKLVRLCATWDKHLPDFGVNTGPLPPWGPSAYQLSKCKVDAHMAARGEDRHYHEESSDEEMSGEESGGEDDDFGTLDALERADIYRNGPDDP
ncbi:hypothetical protein B0H13DRAFT_2243255 [Mycena leptocephala]|nr:hypothetical protein B0H13DRAFT_2243255 [Mycena leptocephala]